MTSQEFLGRVYDLCNGGLAWADAMAVTLVEANKADAKAAAAR